MIEFDVRPDGGEPYKMTAAARDILLWEKAYRGASFSSVKDNLTMTALYQIAHTAARRQGLFAGSLDEFERTVELVFDDDQAEGEADPTPPAP